MQDKGEGPIAPDDNYNSGGIVRMSGCTTLHIKQCYTDTYTKHMAL